MTREPVHSTLRLVHALPDAQTGNCAHYLPRPVPDGWREVDVRGRCHTHQAEWGQALQRWHESMMGVAAAATPWAWVLPGARQHVWHPPIRPLLFALALADYFSENPGAVVWVVDAPPEVGEYVAELTGESVQVEGRASVVGQRRSSHEIKHMIVDAVAVVRRLWQRNSMRRRVEPVDLVVCSIALTARSVRERGDHFFGRVLDGGPLRVHWLYQAASAGARRELESALAESGRSFTFADEHLGWRDAIRIIRAAAGVRRRLAAVVGKIPPMMVGRMQSSRFAERFFEELLVQATPRLELMMHHAISTVLGEAGSVAVCYPYEEKPMEHAVAMAVSEVGVGRTIGFAHAAYASSYLYLQAYAPDAPAPPRPSVLASAGRGFGPWLHRTFGRTDRTVYVGSPRWTPAPPPDPEFAPRRPLRVLVLTSFPYELGVMADWMTQMSTLFDGMAVTIRPNPSAWAEEQKAVFARITSLGSVVVDPHTDLNTQVASTDVVLFCATSAAAEAIAHGRLAVYVEWSDLWVTDPLEGKLGAGAVPRCSSPEALRAILAGIANMNAASYAAALKAQQQVAGEIYGRFNLRAFVDLVQQRGVE